MAHSHEIEARMLALQTQMNPHFLYNALTIISIKAEDSGAAEVVKMCDTLSSILRYVAKDSPGLVCLGQELDSTQREHIGLENVCHRLKLLYGEQAIFRVEAMPQGGSRVSIGGIVKGGSAS